MPHFGKVHGLWLQAARELAAQAVDGVKGHIDPLEEMLLIDTKQRRFTLNLSKLSRCILRVYIDNLAELLGHALIVREGDGKGHRSHQAAVEYHLHCSCRDGCRRFFIENINQL